jgi:hypothetical protein
MLLEAVEGGGSGGAGVGGRLRFEALAVGGNLVVNAVLLKELLGVPCPMGDGTLGALGTELFWDPWAEAAKLAPALARRFVHAK